MKRRPAERLPIPWSETWRVGDKGSEVWTAVGGRASSEGPENCGD